MAATLGDVERARGAAAVFRARSRELRDSVTSALGSVQGAPWESGYRSEVDRAVTVSFHRCLDVADELFSLAVALEGHGDWLEDQWRQEQAAESTGMSAGGDGWGAW